MPPCASVLSSQTATACATTHRKTEFILQSPLTNHVQRPTRTSSLLSSNAHSKTCKLWWTGPWSGLSCDSLWKEAFSYIGDWFANIIASDPWRSSLVEIAMVGSYLYLLVNFEIITVEFLAFYASSIFSDVTRLPSNKKHYFYDNNVNDW